MTTARLLFAASDVPGVGGLATAAYDLFRRTLAGGYDAHHLTLLDDDQAAWGELAIGPDMANPAALPNAHTVRVNRSVRVASPDVASLVNGINPDVMAGFGFIASQRLKRAAPDRPAACITGTCRQAQDYVNSGRARDVTDLRNQLARGVLDPRIVHPLEAAAVELCDLVITHSPLTLELMTAFFPYHTGKIWPGVISFADWITDGAVSSRHHARPFAERDIDVLFVASDWSRREKNYPLVAAVAKRLGDASIHVVGEVPRRLNRVTHHGFIGNRDQLLRVMGRARCVACPSLIDAAPGILYEASALGCNVVASRNCGNWEICHPDLLAEPLGADAMAAGIRRAMRHEYHPGRGRPSWQSFGELLSLLDALAHPLDARRGP